MIIVFKEVINGKVTLTTEELEKLLKQARDEGYTEGYNLGAAQKYTPIITPTTPQTPTTPYSPIWTCNSQTGELNNETK